MDKFNSLCLWRLLNDMLKNFPINHPFWYCFRSSILNHKIFMRSSYLWSQNTCHGIHGITYIHKYTTSLMSTCNVRFVLGVTNTLPFRTYCIDEVFPSIANNKTLLGYQIVTSRIPGHHIPKYFVRVSLAMCETTSRMSPILE